MWVGGWSLQQHHPDPFCPPQHPSVSSGPFRPHVEPGPQQTLRSRAGAQQRVPARREPRQDAPARVGLCSFFSSATPTRAGFNPLTSSRPPIPVQSSAVAGLPRAVEQEAAASEADPRGAGRPQGSAEGAGPGRQPQQHSHRGRQSPQRRRLGDAR